MIRIKNFNVPFNDQSPINDLVAKRLKLPPQHIDEVVIVRKGIDARRYKEVRVEFFGDEIDRITEFNPLTGAKQNVAGALWR